MEKAMEFNEKFYNLVDECIDALYETIKENFVGVIDFEKTREKEIRQPYAVFSDGDEIYVKRGVKRLEFTPNDGSNWIKVVSEGEGDEYVGYIDQYGSENIESDSLFDLYRGVCMAIEKGYFKKYIVYR